MKDRPMAPDEALYELGKEHDAALERLAKAEALLSEALRFVPGGLTSSTRLEFAKRIAAFLEGK